MRRHGSSSDCSICEGRGCSECDGTGRRVRTHVDAGYGLTFSVSGSVPLSDEAAAALAEVARLAYVQMNAATHDVEGGPAA